jgi:hypothetical protein
MNILGLIILGIVAGLAFYFDCRGGEPGKAK